MINNILVLDVGGVLASNLTPTLWQQLAQLGQCSQQELYAAYKKEMSRQLWCGAITEAQWWEWLEERGIVLDERLRKELICAHLVPLPALDKLEQWSQQCSIIIMSNHRTEWLQPLLAAHLAHIQAVHISDQAGLCKPDLRWFQHIDESIGRPCRIMFVDDSTKNVLAAQQCGWHTLLADQQGAWTKAVDEWLR